MCNHCIQNALHRYRRSYFRFIKMIFFYFTDLKRANLRPLSLFDLLTEPGSQASKFGRD